MTKKICVFCGSNSGYNEIYANVAKQFAKEIVKNDMTLVYGGGKVGIMGIISKEISTAFSSIAAVFGVVMIILGLAFIFGTNALSFLVGLQFYIIGFILIIVSAIGLLGGLPIQKTSSIITLILGIVILFIAIFAANNPILITIILGIALIANGVSSYLNIDN